MAFVIKVLKTLRNHWKKSTVIGIALAYGIDYGKTKYEIMQMMRAYCEESKKFGDVPLALGAVPRHVTVILNPACREGKGPALYEKYASPLLHLAGMKVSLIKTEYEGQGKELMDIMDNTDAVLVAGGNGSLLEVVTGLCRRSDVNEATSRFPVGILPIGKTNSLAKRLFWSSHADEVKLLAETAMAVIKGATREVDVMSIEGENGKPVYALSKLEWGAFRDVNEKIPKYWYFGPLKSRLAYVIGSFKKYNVEGSLSYTAPCDGCNKCWNAPSTDINATKRWWSVFVPKSEPTRNGKLQKDYRNIYNDQCGVWQNTDLSAADVVVETINMQSNFENSEVHGQGALTLKIGSSNLTRTQFISEGWERGDDVFRSPDGWMKTFYAKEIKLVPTNLSEENEHWFSIDSENHEVRAIHIRLHANKINVFC